MTSSFNLKKGVKYIVLVAFLVLAVVSVLLTGTVKINYNISDYLDDATDTKISLGIMEEEFGLISNIQVMVSDVDIDEAEEIKKSLKAVENVIFVNFNSQSTDYYKDNNALFVVLVNGNEYSETAKAALAEISETLGNEYGERLELGGTVMEKKLLREAIQGEIILILGISVCLVAVLMLLTASSWIEPLVLLAASGIAVLLNMGTNAIFGEISYITNAIAAILQLALSIDYSIVLLHSYRAIKETEEDNELAMIKAIKDVLKPVSASALTTIAGLFALLFMSFTIGFDIGIVLMKSIVISAITALTLLPALLLILDKLMQKTAKKPLVIKGKAFCDISFKAGRFIVPVAAVIIAVCCVLNVSNAYNFVDSCNKNENISNKFGESGTLIVLYENAEDNREKEKILAELLASYKKEDGTPALKNQVSYASTIGQIYDVDKASKDLGLDKRDAELLFTIYRFTENESAVKIGTREFAEFAIDLIDNDEGAQGFVSDETVKTLRLLLDLDLLLGKEYTSKELGEAIGDIEMLKGLTLEQSAIDQMYGLYFFDEVEQKEVDFLTMLSFLIESGTIDYNLTDQLQTMHDGLSGLIPPEKPMTYNDFKTLASEMGVQIEQYKLTYYWTSTLKLNLTKDTIPYLDLIKNLIKDGYVTDSNLIRIINNYNKIYTAANESYEYTDFFPTILDLAEILTGSAPEIQVEDNLTQQLYIMYFIDKGSIPDGKIGCVEFLSFVSDTAKINSIIKDRLPEGALDRLEKLIADANSLSLFLNDETKLDYKSLTKKIVDFADSITSMEVSVSLSDAAMMGVYVKYATANDLIETGSLSATELLSFVLDASENNELLKSRIDEDMRNTIRESQENMISAEKLLYAPNYSRMLLTVNLPAESAESSKFVEYLTAQVKEIFGENAYVAGEIATTNDLIKAFDDDNNMISIFTVISIFVIIMVVFKSISLPVLLVAIIQGAIWIAMSMSLFSGPMFFMSYIMSMCILMGATIDYGILLSTNYVKNRQTVDKKESLYRALDAAMPTVFTSGLILMICGLVVGLIASQTSISSVGFLLFRGTLVSTVMITLVLPSILYLLDSIVIKLTMKRSLTEIIKSFLNK